MTVRLSTSLATVLMGDKGVKGKIQVHKPPRFTKSRHDASCEKLGGELKCVLLRVPGPRNNICVCIHIL